VEVAQSDLVQGDRLIERCRLINCQNRVIRLFTPLFVEPPNG